MNGVGSDDVEFFACGEDVMAGIVVNDLDARIVDDAMILPGKVFVGDALRNERLELADDNSLDLRMNDKRARSDTRATADNEHRTRMRVDKGWEMPEHALQPHVRRFGRGFDLAAHMEISRPGVVILEEILRAADLGYRDG